MAAINELFTHPTTQYALSWIGLAMLLAPSFWISVTTKRFLDDFNPGNFTGGRYGRRSTTITGMTNDLRRLEKIEARIWGTGLQRMALLLMAGVVIPGLVLAALLKFQAWYLPEEPMLIGSDGSLVFGHSLNNMDLFMFVVDQGLRGGLSDIFEVFNQSVTPLESNPSHLVFSWAIVGYRLLAGLAVTTCVIVFIRLIPGSGPIKEAKSELEKRLQELA